MLARVPVTPIPPSVQLGCVAGSGPKRKPVCELTVELVEQDPGLDDPGASVLVDREHTVAMA